MLGYGVLSAEGVCHDIGFARMVSDGALVIIQKFDPSTLSHVQFLLLKDVLEAPVVGVNSAFGAVQVVSQYLKGKNHCSQFQVMRSVVPFMRLELSRSIGNNLLALHQHATEPMDRCIAVDHKVVSTFR
ncbi:hypothetical protein Hdeb2414_s0021g00580351 [Helianthus debilis subsp. tardiflorus]